jgi:hypothetical protein
MREVLWSEGLKSNFEVQILNVQEFAPSQSFFRAYSSPSLSFFNLFWLLDNQILSLKCIWWKIPVPVLFSFASDKSMPLIQGQDYHCQIYHYFYSIYFWEPKSLWRN